jgi:hypothetical protein
MEFTELTQFQMESLTEVAGNIPPIYMLVKPNNALDNEEAFNRYTKNNAETDLLVALGLLDNVSAAYSDAIEECARTTGRIFRVFRLTPAGLVMFSDQKKPLSIN